MQLEDYSHIQQKYKSQQHIVFNAVRNQDNLLVSIKTSAQEFPSSRQAACLSREYEILSAIEGKGIQSALAFIDTNNSAALITKRADGISLKEYEKLSRIDLLTALKISISVTEIVADIHRQSFCHRDLSPNNIIINPESEEVTIIDFGCALEFPHSARAMIKPNFIEGSLAYMSPEQTGRMNRGLDYRTDFYSLGVVLYELLGKKLPFTVNDSNELIHSHIALHPQPLCEFDPAVPQVLSDIVAKLMSKDAAERYQSAQGLHSDLSKCLKQYKLSRQIEAFPLAADDLHDRFIIPEKLYGRSAETNKLLDTFTKVSNGNGHFAFIAGRSGTGKTSLIKELYTAVIAEGGYIAAGKFDQFLRHQPYSAFIQALSALFKQIMEESDEKIAGWKKTVLNGIGVNGQILIEVIPELQLLIGEQPAVAKLSTEEQSIRFNTAFLNLLSSLGDSRYPLLIFMDDLQWVDAASLSLLEALAPYIEQKSLFIISAYRSNEVPSSHPLLLSMPVLQAATQNIVSLELAELDASVLALLVQDTLPLSRDDAGRLNHLLFEKTRGNPLFFKTMFNTLYNDRHIFFDYELRSWSWNRKAIEVLPCADNVIDMLQSNINNLPRQSVKLLQLAGCIGSLFDLAILSNVAQLPRAKVAGSLLPAVSAGLIQPLHDDFELLTVDQAVQMPSMLFRFAHDRIQQAAYDMLSKEKQANLHWIIGNLQLSHIEESGSEDKLFSAAAHLNQGDCFCPANETDKLIKLNLKAAVKAKKSAAFNVAKACLTHGAKLLGENCWQINHELAMQLHLELAEACYLTSQFEDAEKLYLIIRDNLKKDQDKLKLCNMQAKQYHHQGLYQKSVNLEYQALQLLGFDLPADQQALLQIFSQEQLKIEKLLLEKDFDVLYQQQEVTDADFILTHELLFDTFVDAYLLGNGPLLSAAAAISTRLSMEKGNCPVTSVGYVNYATVLCSSGFYREGHAVGRLAMRLADKYQNPCMKNYTYHVFSLGINHWLKPIKSSHGYWHEASKLSMESGSPYAGWVFLQLAHVLLASGSPLCKVEKQAKESLLYLTNAKLDDIAHLLKLIVLQPLKHLKGETINFNSLDDADFCSRTLLDNYQENPFFYGHCAYSILRSSLLARDIQPLPVINKWLPVIEATVQAQIIQIDASLYAVLHLTAAYSTLDEQTKIEYKAAIDFHLHRFAQWAELCPENFYHKYLLIKAEVAGIEKESLSAIELYEQARELALGSGFLLDAGLIDELTALFWSKLDKPHLMKFRMERAMAVYQRWGASGKMKWLKEQYPDYFQSAPAIADSQAAVSSSIATEDFSKILDLASVIKASQAVSKHIDVDKLTVELLNLAIENVGATRGVLLLKEKQQFIVKRLVDKMDINAKDEEQDLAFNKSKYLSPAVVNYVINSGNSVVFNDDNKDQQFSRCHYLNTHKIKSICCVPIVKQKMLVGLLYLEHSQLTYAFKSDRIQLLKVIASQSAISLENARIYYELELINKNLEYLVKERTQELQQKNRELEILSITDQLTGLYNRRHVEELVSTALSGCERYGQEMSLIMLDIDHFKSVNDNFGHDVGDAVLVHIADILKQNTRNVDAVGRWGGEEFIILLQTDSRGASANAEKLRSKIHSEKVGSVGTVTASFGVTQYIRGDSITSMFKRADIALYKAKTNGRNRIEEVVNCLQ
ncbi:diguanylate cyclase [Psychromonas aquimarina]|uniref:diguanylate cyclase n=1 Tax=Psychromonas aquimarina TaxID=444919 RepID=UPI0004129A2E|nr:diguanylate cyclase [Psychromonas aquimarina]